MQKSLAGVGMYVHRNIYVSAFMCVCVCMHMFVSMCMSLDVCVSWFRYSHHNMPTDSAVDTHINIYLSTMMYI